MSILTCPHCKGELYNLDIQIDAAHCEVKCGSKILKIYPQEMVALECLLDTYPNIASPEYVMRALYADRDVADYPDSDPTRAIMNRLKRKFEKARMPFAVGRLQGLTSEPWGWVLMPVEVCTAKAA